MKQLELILWIILILLTGCGRSEPTAQNHYATKEVKFGEIRTRSSDSGSPGLSNLDGLTFSLSASLDSEAPKTDYLWNIKVSNENGYWKSSRPIYWMNGNPITFFAIAPYVEDQDIIQLNNVGESPTFTYSPPENAEEHLDLIASSCTKSEGTVDFVFDHILTQLRFTIGRTFQTDVKIKEIRLKNISGKGEYNLQSHTWTVAPEYGQYAITDVGFTMDDSKSAGDLISGTYFYLPPQVITNQEACIEIIAEYDGQEICGTMSLVNSRWDAGTIKTYSISYDGTRFNASMLESLNESTRIDIDERNETTD